ncbi:dihydropteroate synthase [Desulfobacterota bacterium AH_259_B03_O07]|nr:dihydropteroate synthase [Desulfobacterota bacterium AH_259_B03_O07]
MILQQTTNQVEKPIPARNEQVGESKSNFCNLRFRDWEMDNRARTLIMGVVNVTPDSFYDGGKFIEIEKAIKQIDKLVADGADIIDIGGESTRPGSLGVTLEEELGRVIPVIKAAVKRFDVPLSVDTTKAKVAEEALEEGASIINDISGLKFEPKIADIASEYDAGLVVMHTTSRPFDMQSKTKYNSLISDIILSLKNSVKLAETKGVRSNSIIIDPGFGFGKTTIQNLLLLKYLGEFRTINKPIMIGTSMKSFIGNFLRSKHLEDRVEGTAATVAIGILNGASIVRVHDVRLMKRVVSIVDAIQNAN